MPHNGVLRTITFRLTVAVSLAFTAATLALFAFIYWQTDAYETRRLDHIVANSLSQLASLPPDSLPRELETWQKDEPNRQTGVTLFALDGSVIRGVLSSRPANLPSDGRVHDVQGLVVAGRPEEALAAAKTLPDGRILVVQRSAGVLVELRLVVLRALVLGVVPLALIGLAAGTALSLHTVRRLQMMHQAIERIMHGNLSERLPGSRHEDDLDRLTDRLNQMLDETERLMAEVKSVGDNIAHDLRTPLTRMRIRLEVGRASLHASPGATKLIDASIADLDYAFGLIAALLRIAEIEGRQRKAGFSMVDLAAIAEEVGEIYAPVAADRGHTLTVDAQPVPSLLADHDLLVEAVANLVDNAIKFTPANGTIRLTVADAAGGPVLRVLDSGPGVAPAERDLVLRRLYRGDKSRRIPGHGLGLNLVSAIATLHEFKFCIEDGPNSAFTIDCRGHPPDPTVPVHSAVKSDSSLN